MWKNESNLTWEISGSDFHGEDVEKRKKGETLEMSCAYMGVS